MTGFLTKSISSNGRAFCVGFSLFGLGVGAYALNEASKRYKRIALINNSTLASNKKSKAVLATILMIAGHLIHVACCFSGAFVYGKMAATGLVQKRAADLLADIGAPITLVGLATWWIGFRMYNAAIKTNRENR